MGVNSYTNRHLCKNDDFNNTLISGGCTLLHMYAILFNQIPHTRVGISGFTTKPRKRKFVPSSHPGPFAVVASSRKRQTKVGTLACFDFL